MHDGLMDRRERAVAPQPQIVAEIGIAWKALRTAAMAGRTIVAERSLAAGERELQQLRVIDDGLKIARRDFVAKLGFGRFGFAECTSTLSREL